MRHVWTDEQVTMLGSMPDSQLAAIIGGGMTTAAVAQKRRRAGIPGHSGRTAGAHKCDDPRTERVEGLLTASERQRFDAACRALDKTPARLIRALAKAIIED